MIVHNYDVRKTIIEIDLTPDILQKMFPKVQEQFLINPTIRACTYYRTIWSFLFPSLANVSALMYHHRFNRSSYDSNHLNTCVLFIHIDLATERFSAFLTLWTPGAG